jgi:DNA-binding MarR family transcriptional regulator
MPDLPHGRCSAAALEAPDLHAQDEKLRDESILKLIEVGNALGRAIGNDRFEWQTARIFLTLCCHGGEMPMQEIERLTAWPQSTVSRNITKLGSFDQTGAQLLESFEDPAYRRRKLVRLTAKGRRLGDQLSAIVNS